MKPSLVLRVPCGFHVLTIEATEKHARESVGKTSTAVHEEPHQSSFCQIHSHGLAQIIAQHTQPNTPTSYSLAPFSDQ